MTLNQCLKVVPFYSEQKLLLWHITLSASYVNASQDKVSVTNSVCSPETAKSVWRAGLVQRHPTFFLTFILIPQTSHGTLTAEAACAQIIDKCLTHTYTLLPLSHSKGDYFLGLSLIYLPCKSCQKNLGSLKMHKWTKQLVTLRWLMWKEWSSFINAQSWGFFTSFFTSVIHHIKEGTQWKVHIWGWTN